MHVGGSGEGGAGPAQDCTPLHSPSCSDLVQQCSLARGGRAHDKNAAGLAQAVSLGGIREGGGGGGGGGDGGGGGGRRHDVDEHGGTDVLWGREEALGAADRSAAERLELFHCHAAPSDPQAAVQVDTPIKHCRLLLACCCSGQDDAGGGLEEVSESLSLIQVSCCPCDRPHQRKQRHPLQRLWVSGISLALCEEDLVADDRLLQERVDDSEGRPHGMDGVLRGGGEAGDLLAHISLQDGEVDLEELLDELVEVELMCQGPAGQEIFPAQTRLVHVHNTALAGPAGAEVGGRKRLKEKLRLGLQALLGDPITVGQKQLPLPHNAREQLDPCALHAAVEDDEED
eukprot:768033-Hanusia_phi.AAC.11